MSFVRDDGVATVRQCLAQPALDGIICTFLITWHGKRSALRKANAQNHRSSGADILERPAGPSSFSAWHIIVPSRRSPRRAMATRIMSIYVCTVLFLSDSSIEPTIPRHGMCPTMQREESVGENQVLSAKVPPELPGHCCTDCPAVMGPYLTDLAKNSVSPPRCRLLRINNIDT